MKISIDLNENIFKLFAYLMMSIVITVTVAVVLLFFILLPIPTKIEVQYYRNVIYQFSKIINCKKLNFKKKYRQIFFASFYVFLYPYEYIYLRILKIKSLLLNLKNPEFLTELDH